MKRGIVVALAVTGSLVLGPTALAATAEPSGLLPGTYAPQDHGKKWDGHKHDKKKKKKGHHHHRHDGHHHHHRHHRHHGDGAHASDYHSHREHPRHDHRHHH